MIFPNLEVILQVSLMTSFPLIPGFAPTQQFKEHYRKVSAQKQEFNRDLNNVEPTKYPLPREIPFVEPERNLKSGLISTTHDHFPAKNTNYDTSQLYQPDWIRLDRHVLRFYGFFKQTVVETNGQNNRNRKLKILFYLEDNSIAINEEKQENSGIPQGRFLKRDKCLNANGNGKFINAYDFRVGQAIEIHGRNIFIYNCDEYTRQFFEKANQPQGPSQEYLNDEWTHTKTTIWVPKKDAVMKDYLEKKLGGGKVASQKQFLQNDRKVLKFFCKCQQIDHIIHFFLADDTIEVREVSVPNSGKDPFPVTFRRQKLPFKFALNQPGQTYAQDFLTPEHLEVGKKLNVFGKVYLLEGCDSFTRNYYLSKFGKVFPVYGQVRENKIQKSNIIIPPHNGIGSEEDSLGYIYKLIPKPPKKDFFKWVDQQIALRFTAILNNPPPEDANRQFIITYYLNDDSLQIYEPPTRNSGFSEGKFLQRGSHKNEEGQVYKPQHMIVGGNLKINGYWFHLTDCDDFTKKWYAENTVWSAVSQ